MSNAESGLRLEYAPETLLESVRWHWQSTALQCSLVQAIWLASLENGLGTWTSGLMFSRKLSRSTQNPRTTTKLAQSELWLIQAEHSNESDVHYM